MYAHVAVDHSKCKVMFKEITFLIKCIKHLISINKIHPIMKTTLLGKPEYFPATSTMYMYQFTNIFPQRL